VTEFRAQAPPLVSFQLLLLFRLSSKKK
jgi:hypothetical protein